MKKFIFAAITAMLLTSLSFNFSSCDEDTVNNILNALTNDSTILNRFLNKDTTNQGNFWDMIKGGGSETKSEFLAGIVEKVLGYTSQDSTQYMLGVWAYKSTDGKEIDTMWFYSDSTVLEHYISVDDTLNIQYSGGYIYYDSFKQMILQVNSVYDYNTKRNINYDEYHIYGVTKPIFPYIFGQTQLVLTDLNVETGETISTITYDYIGEIDKKK